MTRLVTCAFLGLGVFTLVGTVGCSKKDDSSSTTTTNGDSLTTAADAGGMTTIIPTPGAMPMNSGPRGGRHMQAFQDACNGKNANDACTIQLGARTLDGVCNALPQGPDQGKLSCRPTPGQLGPRHGMGGQPGAPGQPAPPAPPAPAASGPHASNF